MSAPQPPAEAQPGYSIDADPAGIRARVADAITGALAFGAQGSHPPPSGHWLEPFWDMARAEAQARVVGYVAALRAEQAREVMPLIGPLLDAWERVHPDDSVHDSGIASYLDPIKHAMTSDEAIPAEAQAQGDRLAIKLLVAAGYVTEAKANEALNIAHGFDKGPLAPPSAPVGVEGLDTAVWNEVLELPDGFRVAEHLPGIWEYQFDIEDEADEDSDRKVSGTSWNHPALAAIAAWRHAYDALAQQPAAVDGFDLGCPHSAIGGCDLCAAQPGGDQE